MGSEESFDISSIINIFFSEGREMLVMMEECLLTLEKEPADMESINSLFRSVHTIKGSSGMCNLEALMRFAHEVENVLDRVRSGSLSVDSGMIGLLLECHDYMEKLIDLYEKDRESKPGEDFALIESGLLSRLNEYTISETGPIEHAAPAGIFREWDHSGDSDLAVESNYWHISLRYGEDVFREGADPKSCMARLAEIGKVVNIAIVDDRLPRLHEMDPESCYLGFDIAFEGAVNRKDIMQVFDSAPDGCEVRVLPPKSTIGDYVKLINDLNESPLRIGEILIGIGLLTEHELETALELQKTSQDADGSERDLSLLGSIMLEEKMVHKPILEAALVKQKDLVRAEERKNKSLRIDAEKLDDLINNVGELVITGSSVRQLAERYTDETLIQSIMTMSRLIENVRDRIMNICMVQIGETFRRFERMVRDLGRETGKEIDLVITGGETELDKTIVEKITDPLMHLVRNSIDHGISTPEERLRGGKPRRGTISISACHEMGNIVIEIRDDGNGLDREKIRAKALERGMILPTQSVTDQELFQMIFDPGFSTADKVTSISGRGVGMDVVKRNIEALRGSIVLESVENEGMMVRIHLPLTLAIIDGFRVMVNGSSYIVPLDLVCEVFEVRGDDTAGMDGANIINLRGEPLPYMRVREFFGMDRGELESECVLVIEYMRKRAGIIVDSPLGEYQTVIKPLGPVFRELSWASGATILGTGEVALILDVPRLIQSAQSAGVSPV